MELSQDGLPCVCQRWKKDTQKEACFLGDISVWAGQTSKGADLPLGAGSRETLRAVVLALGSGRGDECLLISFAYLKTDQERA